MKHLLLLVGCIFFLVFSDAQVLKGKIFDAETKEPLPGASILAEGKAVASSDASGSFTLNTKPQKITVSFSGYFSKEVLITSSFIEVAVEKNTNNSLQEVVVSANRDVAKRTQAPVAISTIHARSINETKATTIDQLINKVSGVYMVNLGNEQHAMSIRQPLGTRSLFLYLEDGIPVRTSGVFNHNTLMEMNMAAVSNIEVIKGPGSSLYGGEAIGGVVNMITQAPTAIPTLKLSAQLNDIGYKRIELRSGISKSKWGVNFSGYYASRKNGFMEYTDFHKITGTTRGDYRFSNKTKLENSITFMNYLNEMTGSVDSAMFVNKLFASQQTFTFRKAITLRYRSTLIHEWNNKSKSTVNAVFRDNSLDQNPAYRIRDDYRRAGNVFIGKKDVAHGEINNNSFKSYVLIAQHRQKFDWLNATLIGGATLDISRNTSIANYIKIKKDTVTKKYVSYVDRPDSLLVNYKTGILNYAAFINFELSPVKKLRLVSSLRYDAFRYHFDNYLPVSAVSGSPDTVNSFAKISPKIGFTYNFGSNCGVYANYSVGFVPPQVLELYRAVKIPTLEPSTFNNYEAGGWTEIIKGKLNADFSIYRLEGKNSIISVRFDDGTYGNANAGATLHWGMELGINATPLKDLQVRISGAYGKHTFKNYIEKGIKYNGNEINSAPHWIHNAEMIYRPLFIKGFRAALEWQKMSEYFMDQTNLFKYEGFDVLNLRLGYTIKGAEIWLNVINMLDAYYAVNCSRSNAGRSYMPGEPRNFNLGISYDFGKLLKN